MIDFLLLHSLSSNLFHDFSRLRFLLQFQSFKCEIWKFAINKKGQYSKNPPTPEPGGLITSGFGAIIPPGTSWASNLGDRWVRNVTKFSFFFKTDGDAVPPRLPPRQKTGWTECALTMCVSFPIRDSPLVPTIGSPKQPHLFRWKMGFCNSFFTFSGS